MTDSDHSQASFVGCAHGFFSDRCNPLHYTSNRTFSWSQVHLCAPLYRLWGCRRSSIKQILRTKPPERSSENW